MERVGIELLLPTNLAVNSLKFLNMAFTNTTGAIVSGATKMNDIVSGSHKPLTNLLGIMKQMAMVNMAGSLLGSIHQAIPEIDQVFGQMKETIIQNIAQPIRKFILPILVQMMNFVRDNRAAFVKIGSVIANVFRAIYSIGTTLVNALIGGFNKVWTAITGGKASIGGFIYYLNLVLLKVFFVFTFISMLLEDVMDVLADAVIWAFKNVIFPIFEEFGRVVSFIAAFFNDPMKAIEEFDVLTQALAAGGITFLASALLSALVPAIGAAITAVIGFTVALLANPITWVVLGVMALVAGIVLLIKNWTRITTFLQTFWNKWKKWALFGIAIFAPFLAIPILLWQNWDTVTGFLIGAFDKIWNKANALFTMVRGKGKGIFDGIFNFGSNLFSGVVTEWNSMIAKIKSIWTQFVNFVVGIGSSIKHAIEEKLNLWWNEFKQTPLGKAVAKGIEVFGGSPQPITSPVGGGGNYGGGGSSGNAPVNVQQNFNINSSDPKGVSNEVANKQKQGFKDVQNITSTKRGN